MGLVATWICHSLEHSPGTLGSLSVLGQRGLKRLVLVRLDHQFWVGGCQASQHLLDGGPRLGS